MRSCSAACLGLPYAMRRRRASLDPEATPFPWLPLAPPRPQRACGVVMWRWTYRVVNGLIGWMDGMIHAKLDRYPKVLHRSMTRPRPLACNGRESSCGAGLDMDALALANSGAYARRLTTAGSARVQPGLIDGIIVLDALGPNLDVSDGPDGTTGFDMSLT